LLKTIAAHVKTIAEDISEFYEDPVGAAVEMKIVWQSRLAKVNEKLLQSEYQRSSLENKLNRVERQVESSERRVEDLLRCQEQDKLKERKLKEYEKTVLKEGVKGEWPPTSDASKSEGRAARQGSIDIAKDIKEAAIVVASPSKKEKESKILKKKTKQKDSPMNSTYSFAQNMEAHLNEEGLLVSQDSSDSVTSCAVLKEQLERSDKRQEHLQNALALAENRVSELEVELEVAMLTQRQVSQLQGELETCRAEKRALQTRLEEERGLRLRAETSAEEVRLRQEELLLRMLQSEMESEFGK